MSCDSTKICDKITLDFISKHMKLPCEVIVYVINGCFVGRLRGKEGIVNRIRIPHISSCHTRNRVTLWWDKSQFQNSLVSRDDAMHIFKFIKSFDEIEMRNVKHLVDVVNGVSETISNLKREKLKDHINEIVDVTGEITLRTVIEIQDRKYVKICVQDVKDSDTHVLLADHVWVVLPADVTARCNDYIYKGTVVQFSAVVSSYISQHTGEESVCLRKVSKFKIISITEKQKEFIRRKEEMMYEKALMKNYKMWR